MFMHIKNIHLKQKKIKINIKVYIDLLFNSYNNVCKFKIK